MTVTNDAVTSFGDDVDAQLERLAALRGQLREERAAAVSPAVARALELAEIELFLGLTCLGYSDELFPHEK
ncbi:MAG: hypothetical protein R8G01_19880 [Ilumatobacteraceae bacterium]|uniref:hypothetical protein n=1 Tax=Ilumatobacter sp. TaxID=1967498 RepID=UPI00296957AA|nr:hypothetical protein [Ilumatobacteraceae bacterium]